MDHEDGDGDGAGLHGGDGEVLAVDVDDEHAGGGWSPPEAIPAAFPPSDLLRRQPSDSLFRGSVFLRRLFPENVRGQFL